NTVEKRFGQVQYETMEIPCTDALLYKEEMGEPLYRRLFSFERFVSRDSLAEIKSNCHKIEPLFADHVGDYNFRTVNIDPGLLTPDNLVMASHREYNHRIYLKDGVFAEVALIYSGGRFKRLQWTHPDLCCDEAIDFFLRVRASFENDGKSNQSEIVPIEMDL
ncbi:MAG: DUF4416 family protein, partial [Candidatus Zixiibacteriota bacterium]